MKRPLTILSFFLLSVQLVAQDHDYLELHKAEAELERLFTELYSDTLTDTEKVLREIDFLIPEALTKPGAMDYTWTRLSRIGVKTSDDERIRIFSWHMMDDQDNYRYSCYIQVRLKKEKMALFALQDNQKPQRSVYRSDQATDDWYGKLYYGIVTKKVKRKTYYTLLGLDFNNSRSNIKSVEVMTITRNKPRFEQEMFFNGSERVDRVVLEYSNQVAITARYEPMLDMITFDHLVPLHPIYENNYEFYGPDGSFDGLKFDKGTWTLQNDIDARLQY
jgi:hypothetical protein